MSQSMQNAQIGPEGQDAELPDHLGYAMPGKPLLLLLMDDNTFDRRTIMRLSARSKFSLKVTEATSIADGEARLNEARPDLIYLDCNLPDGDGIAFSERLIQRMNGEAPPVVIVASDGDERTAIRSLRSGVVDYLYKDQLSVEVFDSSVERCLAARPLDRADLMNEVGRLRRQLADLRDTTRRNMHLARAVAMPMAQYAWRSLGRSTGAARKGEAAHLMKVTQRLTGLLDETLIVATDDTAESDPLPVKVHALLSELLRDAPDLAEYIDVGDPMRFPVLHARQNQLRMLLEELISEALVSVPPDRRPQVSVYGATDPDGNPVLCVADNGRDLAERKKSIAEYADQMNLSDTPLPSRANRMSLCQRLAELNGGQLRITQSAGGGCLVMVRFADAGRTTH